MGTVDGRGSQAADSAEHKAALAKGRAEGRVVRAYLEGLRASKPKRGRRRTADTVRAHIAAIDDRLGSSSAFEELHLVQERRDLEAELDQMSTTIDLGALEADFVQVAASYGTAKGIEYAT